MSPIVLPGVYAMLSTSQKPRRPVALEIYTFTLQGRLAYRGWESAKVVL